MMAKHKHAEVIKAWVDGLPVEVIDGRIGIWVNMAGPDTCPITCFDGPGRYRVKPERMYPVTGMTLAELNDVFGHAPTNTEVEALVHVANAALRHAIDDGRVIDLFQREVRDMAIAVGVRRACEANVTPQNGPFNVIGPIDLAAIIATVKD